MNCITVTTQADLDKALAEPDACVHIDSPRGVWLHLDKSGSATVEASGSATVRAYDTATVRAGSHVAVHLHSGQARVTGGVLIDVSSLDLTDARTWCEHHGVDIVDGRAVLYKALGDDLTAGQGYGRPTVYTVGTNLVAEDWRDNNQCGGGLHLSPTAHQAGAYHDNATRWLRCTADLADVRPIDGGIPKCKVRALTVVDTYTRECLAIEVGQSLKGEDVVRTLERITGQRGWPGTIKADNGSEFISKAMDRWAYENGVELDFSRPGRPTDNAKVESFNGRLREECLNAHWFLSLDDAKRKIEAWRRYYNEARPHTALDWATPAEFARRCGLQPASAVSEEPEISTSDRY